MTIYWNTSGGSYQDNDIFDKSRPNPIRNFLEKVADNPYLKEKRVTPFDVKVIKHKHAVEVYFNGKQGTDKISIGSFVLTGYPANCGLVILSQFYVWPNYKLTIPLLNFIKELCEYIGYSMIEITVPKKEDDPHDHLRGYKRFKELATSFGFETVYEFKNWRSGNTIDVLKLQIK